MPVLGDSDRVRLTRSECSNCDRNVQRRIELEIDNLRREFREREASLFSRLKDQLDCICDELEAKFGKLTALVECNVQWQNDKTLM